MLNPEKSQLFKKALLYLGHRNTSEGTGTDPEKEASIAELEPPCQKTSAIPGGRVVVPPICTRFF